MATAERGHATKPAREDEPQRSLLLHEGSRDSGTADARSLRVRLRRIGTALMLPPNGDPLRGVLGRVGGGRGACLGACRPSPRSSSHALSRSTAQMSTLKDDRSTPSSRRRLQCRDRFRDATSRTFSAKRRRRKITAPIRQSAELACPNEARVSRRARISPTMVVERRDLPLAPVRPVRSAERGRRHAQSLSPDHRQSIFFAI